jgi:rfaE bifunctional protein kinase chain/domain
LINSFLPQHSVGTQKWLTTLKETFDLGSIMRILDSVADLNVTIVGETILDLYTVCQTLGKASKEPVLCLNRGDTVTQGGGALAIAAHCAGLGARVTLVTGLNSKDQTADQLATLANLGIETRLVFTDPRPTIRKERLIDNNTQSRVLEIYDMDDTPLSGNLQDEFLRVLDEAMLRADVTLVADYGHGLLTDQVIDQVCLSQGFLAVNAQTNAGNHGYNSLGKYSRADFATLNGNEARLEVRRRHLDFHEYMPDLRRRLGARSLLVTQGGEGIDLYLADGTIEHAPALAPFVKDRVGAGDAVLAATSLLTAVGAPPPLVAFVGNMVGAWAVSFLGNERTLTLGELKRQITATIK